MNSRRQPLISIITPGYNCGAVVHRLLDSILGQTWQNIEFIFVNDGSTDNTAEVLESYRERFEARGIPMTVLYQENQGQAVALGNGLQYFKGEYLCWCDADDYLEPDSLQCRAEILEAHPEYGSVTGQAYVRSDGDFKIQEIIGVKSKWTESEMQFENLLNGRGNIICCGCHMFRTEAFLQANPDRYIYPSREGQNIQMLLPMYYMHKRYMLYKPVYNYIIYANSHSHKKSSKERQLQRCMGLNEIRRQTLLHMSLSESELERCFQKSDIAMHEAMLGVAVEYRDRTLAKQQRDLLKSMHAYDDRCKRRYREATSPLFRMAISCYRKIKGLRATMKLRK